MRLLRITLFAAMSLFLSVAQAEPENQQSSASNEKYQRYIVYSASSKIDGKPITLRLDSYSGDTWYFTGSQWQALEESGAKNLYKTKSYHLVLNDTQDGLFIVRYSGLNGSSWMYTPEGWQFIELLKPVEP